MSASIQKTIVEISQEIVEIDKSIIAKKEEIKEKEKLRSEQVILYEKALQKEFQEKYGVSHETVAIDYMKFVHQPHKLTWTHGHGFRIPSYQGSMKKKEYHEAYLRSAGGSLECKHDMLLQWDHGHHIVLHPDHYKDCLPTQKVTDAFACIGVEIYISKVPHTERWGS